MKRLFLALVLLAPSVARADTLFTNIGELGSISYQPDAYVFDAGFSDTIFYTANMEFTVNQNYSGAVNLFLPIYGFSTGVDPDGRDSNNNNGVILSLTSGPANEIWRSDPLFPPFVTFADNGYGIYHACCALFEVSTGNLNLQPGTPYVLTAIPWAVNTTNFWYLADNGQPGLLVAAPVTTPEPSDSLLLCMGILLFIVLCDSGKSFKRLRLEGNHPFRK